ncbi:MAG: CBS domain-containing protein [Phenylobacterium sp.]|uniref:CBS domain-containing protein n=1 Tax=Phenylobacterium sp. TaxID=1871053 RepID=UPI00391A910F
MKVADCMTRDVQIADPDMTIREAAQIMARVDAGALPVGQNDRLVGMITDRDIAIRAVAAGEGPDCRVSQVMSADVCYCFDDQDLAEVLANMGDEQIRRLPVVSRDKRLVGIISLGDIALEGAANQTASALSGISRPGGEHSQTRH